MVFPYSGQNYLDSVHFFSSHLSKANSELKGRREWQSAIPTNENSSTQCQRPIKNHLVFSLSDIFPIG